MTPTRQHPTYLRGTHRRSAVNRNRRSQNGQLDMHYTCPTPRQCSIDLGCKHGTLCHYCSDQQDTLVLATRSAPELAMH